MPDSPSSYDLEAAATLQARLGAAESRLLDALDKLPSDHPVALAANELLAVHGDVRNMIHNAWSTEEEGTGSHEFKTPHEASAALEIEREAHTLKGEFKDVLKALFMWKDDPAERVRDKGQLQSDLQKAPL